MAWVAKNEDGTEYIYSNEPNRSSSTFEPYGYAGGEVDNCIELPEGSIKKLIGRKLSFEDEPVEL